MANLQQMLLAHTSSLPPQLHKMVSLKKKDEIKDNKGDWKSMQNIRVILRFRPPNRLEKEEQSKQNLRNYPPVINNNMVSLVIPHSKHTRSHSNKGGRGEHTAVLDHIFNPQTRQKPVFKVVGQPLINAALGGFNATLFAYGQTGSGKTYSMFGANDDGSGTDIEAMGLIPRSFVYLFKQLEQRCEDQHIQNYKVQIQTLQIYNKQLLDLLNANSKTKLEIKTDFTNDSIFVKHLRMIPITSAREALAVLIESSKNRIVAGHKLNAASSRSHMLVILHIKQIRIDGSSIQSKINFGDLAGSENISKAHGRSFRGKNDAERAMDNKRRQEGISINASLSALTRCINKLVKGEHPGYRDSPLTHVLQDSLGGNSKTTLLVCASPHIFNRSETIRTLRFAATAKEVKNKAKINQTLSVKALQKRIKELTAENAQLKSELAIAKGKMRNTGRRSIANAAEMAMNNEQPHPFFAQYSNQATGKSNPTLTFQTQQLLRTDANMEEIYTLTAGVSIAEQQMVIESEEYMQQIESLNEQLQKEVQHSKELQEKTERQNLELDKSEGTISHLRSENQDKAVKLHTAEQDIRALQGKIQNMEFQLNDYQRTFPSFKPRQYDGRAMGNKENIKGNRVSLSVPQNKLVKMDSMDIQVATLEKYLSSLGSTSNLNEFTNKMETNAKILPEMRAEFTEKYEKTEVFYDDMTRKTHDLQSQISSMKFILENLASKYEEDREKMQMSQSDDDASEDDTLHAIHNRTGTSVHYPGLGHIKEETEEFDEDEIIEMELKSKSCWTDSWANILNCGRGNDEDVQTNLTKRNINTQVKRRVNSKRTSSSRTTK
eukprot:20825_1